jgi:hypothetical protein
MATSGDITEVTYSHPLGSGVFFPKANEGNSFDPGGLRNNDDSSAIAGDGSLMNQKNRVRGSFEVLIENDMNVRNDLEVLTALAESSVPAVWTVSVINGTVWAGTGFIVGDIVADVNAGTIPLKVAVGVFEKQ